MTRKNIYKNYRIFQSLNGNNIVYVARHGKQKDLIGRASTEQELIKMMNLEAQRVDDDIKAEKETARLAAESASSKKNKKTASLFWKPGSALKNKGKSSGADASSSDPDATADPTDGVTPTEDEPPEVTTIQTVET